MYLKMKREMKTMEKYVCDVCGYPGRWGMPPVRRRQGYVQQGIINSPLWITRRTLKIFSKSGGVSSF